MLIPANLSRSFNILPVVEPLAINVASSKGIHLDCLRLDKMHPFVSGNKWYKLKYHVLEAQRAKKSSILSFGGAYSNHLHALAYLGHSLKIQTVGVVRGEEPVILSPTLQDCVRWGMQLKWLKRSEYRLIKSAQCLGSYSNKFPDAWIIPEGGAGEYGLKGIEMLFNELKQKGLLHYDLFCCPVGSGTTFAGMVKANLGRCECLGFSALKRANDLESRVEQALNSSASVNPWSICHDYHFGGFAKVNSRLLDFISKIYQQHNFLLDPIYTGKMLYGLSEYIYQGRIKSGARILMVHTGGLQGWRGFGDKSPAV